MMVLIVPAIIVILLFIGAWLVDIFYHGYVDIPFMIRAIAVTLTILIVCAAIPAFLINQCATSSTAKYRIQYETLVYQLENGGYDNPINYSRKDLMNDIYNYNSHVESGRILSKNPWIGVYYPEDWDNLPLIKLEDYK